MFIDLILNDIKFQRTLIKFFNNLIKLSFHFHHWIPVTIPLSHRIWISNLDLVSFVILDNNLRSFSKRIDHVFDLKHLLVDQISIDSLSNFNMVWLYFLNILWNFWNLKFENILNQLNLTFNICWKLFVQVDLVLKIVRVFNECWRYIA